MLEEYISEKGAVKVMVRYKKQRDRNNIAGGEMAPKGPDCREVGFWDAAMGCNACNEAGGRTDPFVWQHRQDQGMQGRCRAGDTGKDLGGVHGKPESL